MTKTIITNLRRLHHGGTHHVVIDHGGRIEKWGKGATPTGNASTGVMVIDGGGALAAPSLFDMRITVSGLGAADSLERWSQVLFASGVTAAAALPSPRNPLDDAKSVRAFLSLTKMGGGRSPAEATIADIHCYGAMTRGLLGQQLAEYGLMGLAGALGFCDGNRNGASSEAFLQILRYAKNFNALIMAHPEDPSLQGENMVMTSSGLATRLGLPSAPAVSEAIQLQRDLTLVGLVGGRYHAGPITTRGGAAVIRAAKKQGLKVTADTAPHYFALNETAIGQYLTHAKLSPPLRTEDDRQGVIEALLDGTIDMVASDHRPLHDDKKRLPFVLAAAGMASIETMVPLAMTILHHKHNMPLEKLWPLFSSHPRRLFGLAGQGEDLAEGAVADMILLDEKTPWQIDSTQFLSPSKNTPLDGFAVRGRVMKTIKNGRVVFAHAAGR